MGTKWRAMFGVDGSNDLLIENITLWNPSPQLSTNGQSETLRVEGGARTIVRNATIKGLQDTLLMSGQVYIANSIIEGNVDFIWGNGAVYFDHCEIKVVARKGYNVQARNAIGAMGYVFVDCNLTADPGITGHVLARTNKNVPVVASMVAYLDCTMGPHIDPVGWLIDGTTRPAPDAGIADGGAALTSPTSASGSTTASLRRARPSTSACASRNRSSSPTPRPRSCATPPTCSAAGTRRASPPIPASTDPLRPPRPAKRGEGGGEGSGVAEDQRASASAWTSRDSASSGSTRDVLSSEVRLVEALEARARARPATSAGRGPACRRGSRG